MPVLTALIQYGSRYHADEVFPDHRPRALEEVFPAPRRYLVGDLAEYVEGDPARTQLSTRGPTIRSRTKGRS